MKFFLNALKYLSILTMVISIYGPIISLRYGISNIQENELQDFIIGKWESIQTQPAIESGTQYKLDFLDTGTLLYNIKSPDVEYYDVEYEYHFVNKDQIWVNKTRGVDSNWDLIRENKHLKIRMGSNRDYIVFRRTPNIMWSVLVISLAILTVVTFLTLPIRAQGGIKGDEATVTSSNQKVNKYRQRAYVFLHRLITFIFFGIGIAMIHSAARRSLFLQIDRPWRPILIFEGSLLIFILGVRLIRVYWSNIQTSLLSKTKLNHFLSALFIGGGIYGILISLFDLVISICFSKIN